MCACDFDMPDVIMKSRLAMLRIVGVLMLMVVLVLGGIGIYMRDKLVYNYWDKQRTKIGSIMKVSGYTIDRGDLVMIDIEGHRYLQRIVGLPGDSIQIKNGILYVNGSEFDTKDIEVDKSIMFLMTGVFCMIVDASILDSCRNALSAVWKYSRIR